MADRKIVGGSFGIGGRVIVIVKRDQFLAKAKHGKIVST
jgi:hypothetical protein